MWALAIKTKLGDTWHQATYGGRDRPVARCNCMIRVEAKTLTNTPDGRLCTRCELIAGTPPKPRAFEQSAAAMKGDGK